jgi:iron complex outermembrane recepter protein
MNRFDSYFTLAATCVVAAVPAQAADLSREIVFSIPAQRLDLALVEFSRQADLQIITAGAQTENLQTHGASGRLTISRALAELLRQSGLAFKPVGDSAISIGRFEQAASVQGEGRDGAASEGRPDALSRTAATAAERIRLAQADQSATASAAATNASLARGSEMELEEVVVTANKRRQRIQDVAASITVLGSEQMERLHATSIQEYATYVPGMIIEGGVNPGMQTIALRGFAADSNRAMVGTYLDESPVGSEVAASFDSSLQFDMMPYDLDRIEILRGPQGTLYGASSMAGIVKYVTRAPDLERFESRAGAETFATKGSDDVGYAVRGGVNLPVVEGKLAIRASLYDKETPGFIDNYLTGEKDQNSVSQYGGRVALLWQASDAVSVKASVISQTISAQDNAIVRLDSVITRPGIYRPLGPIGGDLTNGNPLAEPLDKKLSLYNVIVDWDLGWAHVLSISSYSNNDVRLVQDQSHYVQSVFPGRLMGFHLNLDDKRYTQEFRLTSPSGESFEWMAGAYYNRQTSGFYETLTLQDATDRSLVAGLNPLATVSVPTSYRELASFANGTYRFTRSFDLSLGLRWARNEQTYHQMTAANPSLPNVAHTDDRQVSEESVVTYAVTPRYYLNKNTMLYASVSNGYRPGGPNVYSPKQPEIPTQVDADTITNYEAGLKSDFLDGRAMLQFALFRMDWEDIQISVNGGTGFNYQTNGGTARSQGCELATGFSPMRGLRFNVTAAYTDARLTEDVPAEGWKSGDGLAAAPKWSGSFTANYDLPAFGVWNGRVGGGWRYVGERSPGVDKRDGQYKNDGYGAVDANIGLSNERWDLSLYARNLTDNRVYVARAPMGELVFSGSPLQPRRFGLSLDYRF